MDQYCRYHIDECYILKRTIETLIQQYHLKNIVASTRERTRILARRERRVFPPPEPRDAPYEKRSTINVISGGFAFEENQAMPERFMS